MTGHAHARARRGVLGRLSDLTRGRRPAHEQPRTWPEPASYDTGYDHPGWEDDGRPVTEVTGAREADIAEAAARPGHPPWMTAPQPAVAGPGALGAMYAAADLRDQRGHLAAEYADWYGWGTTRTDIPLDRARPYAPEPAPEPVPVAYPPLSFKADFRDLPAFKQAARVAGFAPAGLVRVTGVTP